MFWISTAREKLKSEEFWPQNISTWSSYPLERAPISRNVLKTIRIPQIPMGYVLECPDFTGFSAPKVFSCFKHVFLGLSWNIEPFRNTK